MSDGMTDEQRSWYNKQMGSRKAGKNSNGNGKEKKREEIVYKYSSNGDGILRESVIIAGVPYFIKKSSIHRKDDSVITAITVDPKIEESIKFLRPPFKQEYPHIPYEFKSDIEPNEYLQMAMKETPDSLLQKIKTIVKRFNEIDEKTATLLSVTIFNSYFQDRFSTVYYLIVVGANGTGKSSFGETFECLGYRAVKMNNATEAFWFRVFGTNEPGQVTIIAEEVDKMDENSQVMGMLKEGYQPNSKVPRMNNDNDKMDFYYPFGIKIMIGEESPSEDKARGLLDRSFKIKSFKGYPDFDIKDIRNPQGNTDKQALLHEMYNLRKILFMYRLLHFKDPYKEIEVGLDGRDRELCKPTLQLFCSLGTSEETQREIELMLQHFLDIKNKRKSQTLEAVIYPIVVNHVSLNGNEIPTGEMWKVITDSLEGYFDEDKDGKIRKPNVFYSADFGRQYRNNITKLICDKFGAEIDHKETGNNLVFDIDHLTKIGKIYGNANGIQTKLVNQPENEHETDSLTHLTHSDGKTPVFDDEEVSSNSSNRRANDNEDLPTSNGQISQDVKDPPSPQSASGESVRQDRAQNSTDSSNNLVKCPNCDYKEHPFYMKIHRQNCQALASIELNVSDFVKIEGNKMGDGIVFNADPATGSLLLENNFLTGSLRMRGKNGGAYPYNYLEFIDKVFGAEKNTIEVCSNSVNNNSCFTVDINPDVRPSLVGDGQELGGIEDNRFSRWRADPPFNEKTAREMYNCELPSLYKLLEAGARVVKPGSLMFLLCSQNVQSGTIGKGNIKRIGFINISVVPNNETRILNIYVKLPEEKQEEH